MKKKNTYLLLHFWWPCFRSCFVLLNIFWSTFSSSCALSKMELNLWVSKLLFSPHLHTLGNLHFSHCFHGSCTFSSMHFAKENVKLSKILILHLVKALHFLGANFGVMIYELTKHWLPMSCLFNFTNNFNKYQHIINMLNKQIDPSNPLAIKKMLIK